MSSHCSLTLDFFAQRRNLFPVEMSYTIKFLWSLSMSCTMETLWSCWAGPGKEGGGGERSEMRFRRKGRS